LNSQIRELESKLQQQQDELVKLRGSAQEVAVLQAQLERATGEITQERARSSHAETRARELELQTQEVQEKLSADLAALREEKSKQDEGTILTEIKELRVKVEEYKKREKEWEEEKETYTANQKAWAVEKSKLEGTLRQLSTQIQDTQVMTKAFIFIFIFILILNSFYVGKHASTTYRQSGGREERITTQRRVICAQRTAPALLGESGTRPSARIRADDPR
jgi:hypothetical protein